MTGSRAERISAYLDGELSPVEAAAFERDLERDPKLARELERLLLTDAQLRAAIAESIPSVPDDATLERFGLSGVTSPTRGRPVAANDREPPRWWLPAGAAIAASVAALALLLPSTPAEPWRAQGFSTALEVTPSLQSASIGKSSTLIPRLTFAAADGRYCREFQLRSDDSRWNRDGIACRSDDRWPPEIMTPATTDALGRGSIELAGSNANPTLDQAYERLGGSAPIDANAESRAIRSHWAPPPK